MKKFIFAALALCVGAWAASPALAQNMPPVIDLPVVAQIIQTTPLPLRVQQGGTVSVTLSDIFSDPDDDTLTYTVGAVTGPPGVTGSLNQATSVVTYTATADAAISDQYFPELSATDGVNPTSTSTFLQIQVFAPGTIPSPDDLVIEITGTAHRADIAVAGVV